MARRRDRVGAAGLEASDEQPQRGRVEAHADLHGEEHGSGRHREPDVAGVTVGRAPGHDLQRELERDRGLVHGEGPDAVRGGVDEHDPPRPVVVLTRDGGQAGRGDVGVGIGYDNDGHRSGRPGPEHGERVVDEEGDAPERREGARSGDDGGEERHRVRP